MPAEIQTTTTTSQMSQPGMSFLGFDFETSARVANILVIVLAALGVAIGAFAYRWGNESQMSKDAKLEAFQLESRTKLANLEIEAANAKERAANAEKALLELQERLRHRVISPAERAAFRSTVGTVPKGSPILVHVLGNKEAVDLGEQLRDVLVASGWTVEFLTGFTKPESGLSLHVTPSMSSEPLIKRLSEALGQLTIGFRLVVNAESADPKRPVIRVWDK